MPPQSNSLRGTEFRNQSSELDLERRFQAIDVFHGGPFSGNPLAVILDSENLDTETMQRITRWLNLSETTFLLPPTTPEADYRVRIFTLDRELPFAGHPTLGSAHAWLTAGGTPRTPGTIIQECPAGLIRLHKSGENLAFAAPPLLRSGPVDPGKIQELATFLRIDPADIVDAQWADNGPGWIVLVLASAEAVLAVNPQRSHAGLVHVGMVGPYPPASATQFEIRALFSGQHGAILEDPVTGSLNASTAQFLLATGRATAPYSVSQGTALGRTGRIHITQDDTGTVWVAGATKTLFQGLCTAD